MAPLWVQTYERLADAVRGYRGDRAELIDILAFSLDECALQFPIVESGEPLDDIDPFTFFAAFSREIPVARRKRLIDVLAVEFERELEAPESFEGLAVIEDRAARFFSRDVAKQGPEIEALWDLFDAALAYADDSDPEAATRFDAARAHARELRIADQGRILVALSWIRPRTFAAPPKETDVPEASLDSAQTAYLLERSAVEAATLFETYLARLWAVSCFQAHWNIEAEDFAGMLERSLVHHGGLLFQGYFFNPYKEIMTYAEKEPETLRQTFRDLFDESQLLAERMVRFEAATAQLFERYRSDIVRAMPRRSSHGNLYAISVYLFLRFPYRYYLYSPSRVNALRKATGYKKVIRTSDPDSVERYFELCELVRAQVLQHERLLSASTVLQQEAAEIIAEDGTLVYADTDKRLLIEALAWYEVEGAR